jgi:hypothetical protein
MAGSSINDGIDADRAIEGQSRKTARMKPRPDHWKHDRDHFYKYMTSSTAKVVLKNRSLKWSPASAFNDPFDMQFDLHLRRAMVDRAFICRDA